MFDNEEKLNLAIEYHNSGDLLQAENLYIEILSNNEDDADALYLLGLVKIQQKDINSAIRLISSSLKTDPDYIDAIVTLGNCYFEINNLHLAVDCYQKVIELGYESSKVYNNLGIAFKHLNQIPKSIECFNKAITLDANYCDAYNNLAIIYANLGMYSDSLAFYSELLQLNKNYPYIYYNLANVYRKSGSYELAITYFKMGVQANPEYFNVHYNLGITYFDCNQYEEALCVFNKALGLNPNSVNAYIYLGKTYEKLKNKDLAIKFFFKAIEINKNSHDAYINLGNVYLFNGDVGKAVEIFSKAIELFPESFDACNNLANVLIDEFKINEAIQLYEDAYNKNPNSPEILCGGANAYLRSGNIEKSNIYLDKALAINPEFSAARFIKANNYLILGNYKDGWKEYEYRASYKNLIPEALKSMKKWNGENLQDKTILVHYEQGFGDTIQFVRFMHNLKNMGAEPIFAVKKELFNLIKLNFPYIHVILENEVNSVKFDYWTLLMSLPYFLNTNNQNIPLCNGYLKAENSKIEYYKQNYFDCNSYKVGIYWQGNPEVFKNRSIKLKQFENIAKIDNIKLFSLQKGFGSEQLTEITDCFNIVDLGSTFKDFSDTAAAIEGLDLVITVDSVIAHLAGALGKTTWVLLPYMPEWRWLLNIENTPWYDSLQLYRQKEPNNWQEPMEKICSDLQNIAK